MAHPSTGNYVRCLQRGGTDITMFMAALTGLIAASLATQDDIQTAKFSQYGSSDYSRNPLDGTDYGDKTKIQCSRLCAFHDDCLAFQISPTGGTKGRCTIFEDYTVSRKLEASNGTRYYEKKQCLKDLHIDASLVYRADYTSPMFSGDYVRLYRFILTNNRVTGVSRLGHVTISSKYPGYTTTVDAALEMPGITPSRTILLKGRREACYERTAGTSIAFTQCPDTSYFNSFFDQTGLTSVDAATVVDLAANEVHVVADDAVYILNFNDAANEFDTVEKYEVLEDNPNNPWCNTTKGLTAMLRLTSDTFYLFEGAKYFSYSVLTRQITANPLVVCDN